MQSQQVLKFSTERLARFISALLFQYDGVFTDEQKDMCREISVRLTPPGPLSKGEGVVKAYMSFDEDSIGHCVRLKVKTLEDIDFTRTCLRNAKYEETKQVYTDKLQEYISKLAWINQTLLDLKLKHKLVLQNNLARVDNELREFSDDAFEVAEMQAHKRQLVHKIAQLEDEMLKLKVAVEDGNVAMDFFDAKRVTEVSHG